MRSGFALLVPVLLIGCAKKPDHPAGPYFPPRQSAPEIFSRELSRADVFCADSRECPANVGLVVILSEAGMFQFRLGQCSGTLIGEDIVVMNSHCVPDEVKADPAKCKDQLGFVRAQDPTERAACANLILASEIDEDAVKPDYAVMRLQKKLTKTPTEVATVGFPDQKSVTMYTVDPSSDERVAGVLRRKDCLPVQNSVLARSYTHDLAPVVSLFGSGCHVIPGNSGSGILNSEGKLIGVVSHGRDEDAPNTVIMGMPVPTSFGLGANFACADLGKIGIVMNPACPSPGEAVPDLMANLLSTDRQAEFLHAELLKIVSRAPAPYLYRVRLEGLATGNSDDIANLGVELTPACVKPVSGWIGGVDVQTRQNGSRTERFTMLMQNEESLRVSLVADQYLRPGLQGRRTTTGAATYEMVVTGAGQTRFSVLHGTSRTIIARSLDLSLCSEAELANPYLLSQ